MTITDVKIRRLLNENRMRAIVSVTIDNSLAIHDIKVIQGDDRLFVAMPSRREENGNYRDIIHPISSDTRHNLETTIIEQYNKYVTENQVQ